MGTTDPAYRDAYRQLCDAVTRQAEAGNGYSLFGSRTSIIEPPESVEQVVKRPRLTERAKQKILAGNALRRCRDCEPRAMRRAQLLRWRPRPPCHETLETIVPTNVRLRGPDMAPA